MKNNTDSAKQAVKAYLDRRAATDPQFAASYAKEGKTIDECFRYILGEASRRGNAVCMTDEEGFGLAVHYYDEDDITINPVRGNASASRPAPAAVELTDEEKAAAREKALKAYELQCLVDQQRRETERRKKETEQRRAHQQAAEAAKPYSPSLFD